MFTFISKPVYVEYTNNDDVIMKLNEKSTIITNNMTLVSISEYPSESYTTFVNSFTGGDNNMCNENNKSNGVDIPPLKEKIYNYLDIAVNTVCDSNSKTANPNPESNRIQDSIRSKMNEYVSKKG